MLTIANPLVAAAIGVLAFHEQIAATPAAIAIEVGSVMAMVFGVFGLTQSPLVRQPAVVESARPGHNERGGPSHAWPMRVRAWRDGA